MITILKDAKHLEQTSRKTGMKSRIIILFYIIKRRFNDIVFLAIC